MKNARTLLVLLALLGLFLAGWWLGRRSVGSSIVEHTRIDTVFFERPQSVTHSRQLVSVNIPKLLFAPADTVLKTVIAPDGTDSVPVRLPFERREYRDSTYYAVVSGIAVGGYRPTLERIETYGRTVTPRSIRMGSGTRSGRLLCRPDRRRMGRGHGTEKLRTAGLIRSHRIRHAQRNSLRPGADRSDPMAEVTFRKN